jgi:hypothetical protein
MATRLGDGRISVFAGRDYRIAVEVPAGTRRRGRVRRGLLWLARAWFRGLVLHVAAIYPRPEEER